MLFKIVPLAVIKNCPPKIPKALIAAPKTNSVTSKVRITKVAITVT